MRSGSSMYEVYAIKYAHHARRARENFIGGPIGGDAHDGPMPLDYFVWLVRGEGREIVVDTGFSAAMAAKRGREHLRCPTEGLKLLGTDAGAVKDNHHDAEHQFISGAAAGLRARWKNASLALTSATPLGANRAQPSVLYANVNVRF